MGTGAGSGENVELLGTVVVFSGSLLLIGSVMVGKSVELSAGIVLLRGSVLVGGSVELSGGSGAVWWKCGVVVEVGLCSQGNMGQLGESSPVFC